jgi:hypothetical protein
VIAWLLNTLPIAVLAILVVGGYVGLAVVAVWLVRRHAPSVADASGAGVSSQVLGALTTVYAIVLALVVVSLYSDHVDASDTASREATALAQVVRDVQILPAQQTAAIDGAVRRYAEAVVEREWPAMRDGGDSEEAWLELRAIYTALQGVEPQAPAEVAFYEDAVQRLGDVVAARRQRLDAADGSLPASFEAVLFAGSLVVIGYAILASSRIRWHHLATVLAVTVLIACSILLAMVLDHPYSGDLAISPDAFRTGVLDSLLGDADGVG